MENVLVVVHWQDLPQFEVFCYCLDRFWTGNKSIKIVISDKVHKEFNKDTTRVNSKRIIKMVRCIAEKYLHRWQYEIKFPNNNNWADGWVDQQQYKVVESANSGFTETIVFDCKDWLISEFGPNDLKTESGEYLIKLIKTESSYWRTLPMNLERVFSTEYWDCSEPVTMIPENLTPWIWNNKDLQEFVSAVEEKEKLKLVDLEFFPGIAEIEMVYVFVSHVLTTPVSLYRNNINFDSLLLYYRKDNKIGNYFKDLTKQEKQFFISNQIKNIKIMKVHRTKLSHFNKLLIADILVMLEFPATLIRKWKDDYTKYQNNWQHHDDLVVELYKDRNK